MIKRKSIPIPLALPNKHSTPDDGLWQSETFTSIQDYLFFESGYDFDMPEELISYWESTQLVTFDEFKRRWLDFSGSPSEFIQFSRDFNGHWTSLHYSDTLTTNQLNELYNLALAEAVNMPETLFSYWHNSQAVSFSKFIQCWQSFTGSTNEFIEYLRDYNSNWTSLHHSATLHPDSLDFMTTLALFELSETEQQLIEAECELYFGEDEEEVTYKENAEPVQGYDEYCDSRCNGNHKRYFRRLNSARHHKKKISLAIPNVESNNCDSKFDGSVMIHGGLLWQRYNYAKTVLTAYTTVNNNWFHIDLVEPSENILRAIRVLDSFGPVTPRIYADLLFIIKKYKRAVTYASHYNYYYKGRYFVVKHKNRKATIHTGKSSRKNTTIKQKQPHLNADYRMKAKHYTPLSNTKNLTFTKTNLHIVSPQIPAVLPHPCMCHLFNHGLSSVFCRSARRF